MILYTIKSGKMYVKTCREEYALCGLNEASVFPEEAMQMVRDHKRAAAEQGMEELAIYRLVITETKVK